MVLYAYEHDISCERITIISHAHLAKFRMFGVGALFNHPSYPSHINNIPFRRYTKFRRATRTPTASEGAGTQKSGKGCDPKYVEDRITFPLPTLCQPRSTPGKWIERGNADKHLANLATLIISELLHPSRPHAISIADHITGCTNLAATAISQADALCPDLTTDLTPLLNYLRPEASEDVSPTFPHPTDEFFVTPGAAPLLVNTFSPPPFFSPALPLPPDAVPPTPTPQLPSLLSTLLPLTHRLSQLIYTAEALLAQSSAPTAIVSSAASSTQQSAPTPSTVLSMPKLRIDGQFVASYSEVQELPDVPLLYEFCEHIRQRARNGTVPTDVAQLPEPLHECLAPRGGCHIALPMPFTSLPAELPLPRGVPTTYARTIAGDALVLQELREATSAMPASKNQAWAHTLGALAAAAEKEVLPPTAMDPRIHASRVAHKSHEHDLLSSMLLAATLGPSLAKVPLPRRLSILGAIAGLSSSPTLSDRLLRAIPHILAAAAHFTEHPPTSALTSASEPTLPAARAVFETCMPPLACVPGHDYFRSLLSVANYAEQHINIPDHPKYRARLPLRGTDVHALAVARAALTAHSQLASLVHAEPALATTAPSLLRAVSVTGLYTATFINRRFLGNFALNTPSLPPTASGTGAAEVAAAVIDPAAAHPSVTVDSVLPLQAMEAEFKPEVVPSAPLPTPATTISAPQRFLPSDLDMQLTSSLLPNHVAAENNEPVVMEAPTASAYALHIMDIATKPLMLPSPLSSLIPHALAAQHGLLRREMSLWGIPAHTVPHAPVYLCPATLYSVSQDVLNVLGHQTTVVMPPTIGLLPSLAMLHPMRPYQMLADMDKVFNNKTTMVMGTQVKHQLANHYYSRALVYLAHVCLSQRGPPLLCVLRALSNVPRMNTEKALRCMTGQLKHFDQLARKGLLQATMLYSLLGDGSSLYELMRRLTNGELALLRDRRIPLYGRAREVLAAHHLDLVADPLLCNLFLYNGFAALVDGKLEVAGPEEAARVHRLPGNEKPPRAMFKEVVYRANAPMFVCPPRTIEEAVPTGTDEAFTLPTHAIPASVRIMYIDGPVAAQEAFQRVKQCLPPVPEACPAAMLSALLRRDLPQVHEHTEMVRHHVRAALLQRDLPFNVEHDIADPSNRLAALMQASALPENLEAFRLLARDPLLSVASPPLIIPGDEEPDLPSVSGVSGGLPGLEHVFPLIAGLDTESIPAAKGNQPGPVQLLQLAVGDVVLLVDLQKWCFEMDALLFAVLAHPAVLKTGVGVGDDIVDLKKTFPDSLAFAHVQSFVCLAEALRLATLYGNTHSTMLQSIKKVNSLYTPVAPSAPLSTTGNTLYHMPLFKVSSESEAVRAEAIARVLVDLAPEVSGICIPSRFDVPLATSADTPEDIARAMLVPSQTPKMAPQLMTEELRTAQGMKAVLRGSLTSASSTTMVEEDPSSQAISAPCILSALCYTQSRLPVPIALGLRPLAMKFAGRLLSKTEQISSWQDRPLSPSQIDYAAADAHIAPIVYRGQLRRLPHNAMLPALRALVRAAVRRVR